MPNKVPPKLSKELNDGPHGDHFQEDVMFTHVVVIEWNGKKPPSSWYNRLHEYGLFSRSPKGGDVSLLEWRSKQQGKRKSSSNRGVVLQEGLIAVSSATLARDISAWAEKYGAEHVEVGKMVTTKFSMSEKDFDHYSRLQSRVTKRGPKVGDKGFYSVTCYDEVKTFVVEYESLPDTCPTCGGSNIQARMGTRPVFPTEFTDGNPFAYWVDTRFSNGTFEIPELRPSTKESVIKHPKRQLGSKIGESLGIYFPSHDGEDGFSMELNKYIGKDFGNYAHTHDVAYCVSKMSLKERVIGRTSVIEAYVMNGGMNMYSFHPRKDEKIDVIDLCILDGDYAKFLTKVDDQ